jgi:hypothetical protein
MVCLAMVTKLFVDNNLAYWIFHKKISIDYFKDVLYKLSYFLDLELTSCMDKCQIHASTNIYVSPTLIWMHEWGFRME